MRMNVDAAVTRKLALRRGSVSLGVRNLLGTDIRYRDVGYKTSDDFNVFRPFLPDREIYVTFALNY